MPQLLRDSGMHVVAGSELMYTWEMCVIRQEKAGTVTPRLSTNTNTHTATKVSAPVPMDVSQTSSNVSKSETVEQENASYQDEQDQECGGDELFAVKGKGKGG